jgi:hypothetical protein
MVKAMLLTKLKLATAVVLAAAMLTAAAGMVTYRLVDSGRWADPVEGDTTTAQATCQLPELPAQPNVDSTHNQANAVVKIDPEQAQPKAAACKGCAGIATPTKIVIIHTHNFECGPAADASSKSSEQLEAILRTLKSQGMTLIIAKGKIYLVGPKSMDAHPCTIAPAQCVPESLHSSPDGAKLYFTGYLQERPCQYTLQGLRMARANGATDAPHADATLPRAGVETVGSPTTEDWPHAVP